MAKETEERAEKVADRVCCAIISCALVAEFDLGIKVAPLKMLVVENSLDFGQIISIIKSNFVRAKYFIKK